MTRRIGMWSGPRNISTAMMRSWENRRDCSVVDEPFYACYLSRSQSPHPCFEEILQVQSSDYHQVANQLTGSPCETPIQYQKLMTHHMLADAPLTWSKALTHCFLIRDPAQVVASYVRSRGVCKAQDIGIIRQAELFEDISRITGQNIPVIDSNDVLRDPQRILTLLCEALSLSFDPAMLEWPPGPRASDGVWASHWYKNVERSTGFGSPSPPVTDLTDWQWQVVEQVTPYFERMHARRIH